MASDKVMHISDSEFDEDNWVNVNTKSLQNENYPNIFAIGDAARINPGS